MVGDPEMEEDALAVVDHDASPTARPENPADLPQDQTRMGGVVYDAEAVHIIDRAVGQWDPADRVRGLNELNAIIADVVQRDSMPGQVERLLGNVDSDDLASV